MLQKRRALLQRKPCHTFLEMLWSVRARRVSENSKPLQALKKTYPDNSQPRSLRLNLPQGRQHVARGPFVSRRFATSERLGYRSGYYDRNREVMESHRVLATKTTSWQTSC
ncbi:hypothetical protein [Mesorhizobium sp. L2C066B000]|uniref:hypothetical protein n=1 Tax=Mesorhizobium sp. L2C066B000 TaxID=1287105 RepID=UPI0012DC57A9|nr:hypothetical protein [Mesorhizobium sp. L2C066B000]